jgi:hypothetical protein
MSASTPPPPSRPSFVVRPRHGDALPDAVADWGEAVALASALGGWRVQWRGADGDGDEAQARLQLQKLLGPAFQVLPVLQSEDGAERFPTGHIVVRWQGPATDDDLQLLAKRCGLELLHRTRFTDRQAVYRAGAGAADVDLNALVAQAVHNSGVEKAWLEAESAYQRAP